jgi:TrmH family RNA methyltransferase
MPQPKAHPRITSLANDRVKEAIRLRQRSHRDERNLMLIEGYREIRRALDNRHTPTELFVCPEMFQGANEGSLIEACEAAGAAVTECTAAVFAKMAYRERPEGLLAVAPQVRKHIADLRLPAAPLLVVAESVEKPGNLGTILRSADAAGVHAVIVCDRCTDINNPNVVRASIGAVFSLPVVEAPTSDVVPWLKERGIRILSASPHAETLYTDEDMAAGTAIVLGSEQYGLSEQWMNAADRQVRIPMLGQSDSLNVAAAATILLFEAVRQRQLGRKAGAATKEHKHA